MRTAVSTALFAAIALSSPAIANDDVLKQTSDPNNWASQSGDYTLQRYSKLDQINTRQRQEFEGRLDVLDWRAARP